MKTNNLIKLVSFLLLAYSLYAAWYGWIIAQTHELKNEFIVSCVMIIGLGGYLIILIKRMRKN